MCCNSLDSNLQIVGLAPKGQREHCSTFTADLFLIMKQGKDKQRLGMKTGYELHFPTLKQ